MNKVQLDNIHTNIFTPREHQVELLWQCLQQNTVSVLSSQKTQEYLSTSLARELNFLCATQKNDSIGDKVRLLFVGSRYSTLEYLCEAIEQNTPLTAAIVPQTEQETDLWTEEQWNEITGKQVLFVTSDLVPFYCEHIDVDSICLLFLLDAHECLVDVKLQNVIQKLSSSCRVVGASLPILPSSTPSPSDTPSDPPPCSDPNSDTCSDLSISSDPSSDPLPVSEPPPPSPNPPPPHVVNSFIKRLSAVTKCSVTTSGDIVTLIGNENRATESIIVCSNIPQIVQPNLYDRVWQELNNVRSFMEDHRYNLVEIYGDLYKPYVEGLPDPKEIPMNFLNNIEMVYRDMGLWACDRAALYALVEIEKLKKKTAYDRHYLLLCVIFTFMAKIRTIISEVFEECSDLEKITNFSTPKILRLVDILRRIRPVHFVDPRNRSHAKSLNGDESDDSSSESDDEEEEECDDSSTGEEEVRPASPMGVVITEIFDDDAAEVVVNGCAKSLGDEDSDVLTICDEQKAVTTLNGSLDTDICDDFDKLTTSNVSDECSKCDDECSKVGLTNGDLVTKLNSLNIKTNGYHSMEDMKHPLTNGVWLSLEEKSKAYSNECIEDDRSVKGETKAGVVLPPAAEEDLPLAAEEVLSVATEEGSPSAGEEGSLPAVDEGSLPAVEEGSLPAVEEGSLPAGEEGSLPAAEEGSPPAAEEGSPPAAEEGSPPAAEEGSPSAAEEGSPSAAEEGSPPAAEEGSPPAAEEGSPPAAEEGSPPAAEEGSHPAAEEGSHPAGCPTQGPDAQDIYNMFRKAGRRRKKFDMEVREKVKVHNPEDPDSVCGLIFVGNNTTAKILYRLLKELSDIGGDFAWVFPQYTVEIKTDDETIEDRVIEVESKKQEEVLRRFRHLECNMLVTTKVLEEGIDVPLCNLVIRFDCADSYQSYVHSLGRARPSKSSHLLHLVNNDKTKDLVQKLSSYEAYSKVLLENNVGKTGDEVMLHYQHPPAGENELGSRMRHFHLQNASLQLDEAGVPVYIIGSSTRLYQSEAMQLLNKYCAKLPSDTFTRLTVQWQLKEKDGLHCCVLGLPINSPLKDIIIGPWQTTPDLAKQSAAFLSCIVLHQITELDDNLMPVGKESIQLEHHLCPPPESDLEPDAFPRPGTTKRRQYYYKKIAKSLLGGSIPALEEGDNSAVLRLFMIKMELRCAIPDQQNTRGRKIYRPELSNRNFGILTSHEIPETSAFPVFTRSGEVMVHLTRVCTSLEREALNLNQTQLESLNTFHQYTFTNVLRLEKYPIKFDPLKANESFFVVPLITNTGVINIDWPFVDVIAKTSLLDGTIIKPDQETFVFEKKLYEDAVVMPWYRNIDQPQYFYVAEICEDLHPQSDFPDAGFETFEKYYLSKYELQIVNLNQPLLDVDHTSARLNLLTPRHVNRKGVALPTTSEQTKKAKRENLQQKQILVPELCAIHPFPASLWRKAVCLPTILYRVNSLLLADELRMTVAREIGLGKTALPRDHVWPALDFGWTLADVFKKASIAELEETKEKEEEEEVDKKESKNKGRKERRRDSFSDDELDEEVAGHNSSSRCKMEIGTWDNDLFSKETEEKFFEEMDGGESEEEMDMSHWPENLTLLNEANIVELDRGEGGGEDKAELGPDWGTGIFEEKSPPKETKKKTTQKREFKTVKKEKSSYSKQSGGSVVRVCSPSTFNEYHGGELYNDYENDSNYEDYNNLDDDFCSSGNESDVAEEEEIETCKVKQSEFRRKAKVVEKQLDLMTGDVNTEELESLESKCTEIMEKKCKELYSEEVFTKEDEDLKFEKSVRGIWTQDNQNTDMEVTMNLNPLPREDFQVDYSTIEKQQTLDTLMHSSINTVSTLYPVGDDKVLFSFDEQPQLSDHDGPPPSIILQALTMSNANDGINLERLETIGDSYLKYAITTYLYCTYPHQHEGKLSYLRSKQVSNLNLYRLGRHKRLGEYMVATKFEPHDNWLPPSYYVPVELEEALIASGVPTVHWNMAELPNLHEMSSEQIKSLVTEKTKMIRSSRCDEESPEFEEMPNEETPIFIPYNLLTQHSIPDKSIADSVEALIGAYLTTCGPKGALLFMSWLGIKVLPTVYSESKTKVTFKQIDIPFSPLHQPEYVLPSNVVQKNLNTFADSTLSSLFPSSTLEDIPVSLPDANSELRLLLSGYNKLEEAIGYTFKDKSYLLQAFTHASFCYNRLTDCYQRLEFLGDAVLDYLITRHLYEDCRQHSPGALTDLRSALVNNTIFATLAVKNQFHKYFRHFSPGLDSVIRGFVKSQVENNHKIDDDYYLLEGEAEAEVAEDIEVPKALGDVFESVAGAIYLDSGFSLDAVWSVYYPIMRESIAQFTAVVPKSPIRELLEMEPETAKFGRPERLVDGKVRVTVEIFGKGKFSGVGRNYRIAKSTAAKRALRFLVRNVVISHDK